MDWRTPFWGLATLGAAVLIWSAGMTPGYPAVAVFLIGCVCVLGTIATVVNAKRRKPALALTLPPAEPATPSPSEPHEPTAIVIGENATDNVFIDTTIGGFKRAIDNRGKRNEFHRTRISRGIPDPPIPAADLLRSLQVEKAAKRAEAKRKHKEK